MHLANLAPTPHSSAWYAWNGRSRTSCLPALTETTPDGKRRSRTVLLRDAERRIRLGYLNEQFDWRLLGPAQDNWTDYVTHWQWLADSTGLFENDATVPDSGGNDLCILAAILIEMYATAPLPPNETESENDPPV